MYQQINESKKKKNEKKEGEKIFQLNANYFKINFSNSTNKSRQQHRTEIMSGCNMLSKVGSVCTDGLHPLLAGIFLHLSSTDVMMECW